MPQATVHIKKDADRETLVRAVQELQRIIGGSQTFGDPGKVNIELTAQTGRPFQRVGTPDNLATSVVEVTLADVAQLNTNLTVRHGLNLPAPPSVAGPNQRLNCRWWVAGVRQKGTAPTLTIDQRLLVQYVDGTVGSNEIGLRFHTNAPLAGSGAASTGDLIVTLMFFPAST